MRNTTWTVYVTEGQMISSDKNNAFIAYDFDIEEHARAKGETSTVTLNTLLLNDDYLDYIGVITDPTGVKQVCCTSSAITLGLCKDLGKLIYSVPAGADPSVLSEIHSTSVQMDAGNSTTSTSNLNLASKYDIESSGFYTFYFVVCVHDLEGDYVLPASINLKGSLDFYNSHGWLRASFYGFLPFHLILTISYIVIFLFYTISLYRIRDILITKFNVAMVVLITISLIENICWFIVYNNANTEGSYFCCPVLPMIWVSTTINVVKRTMIRVLMLVLVMGLGVTKSELSPGEKRMVLCIGLGYLVTSLNADLQQWAAIEETSNLISFLWQIPVSILDTIILCSIYFLLTAMMEKLTSDGQTEKLKMYQTLFKVLGSFLFLWFVFATISLGVNTGDTITLDWTLSWLFVGLSSAFWHIIFLLLIVSIAVIWPPSEKSAFMSYTTQVPSNEDDADHLELGDVRGESPVDGDEDFFDDVRASV